MVFKKWHKPANKKKVEEVKEVKVEAVEEETPVTSVVENEIKGVEKSGVTKASADEIGNVSWTVVHMQPRGIRFETYKSPVPIFKIKDEEIRQWLVNKGYGTDVYKKDKEWLEKHHVDMKMVEKLKQYLSQSYSI